MSRIHIQSSRGTIDLRPVMGRRGLPGVNAVENSEAVAAYLTTPGNATYDAAQDLIAGQVADHLPVTAAAAIHLASASPVAVSADTLTTVDFDTDVRVDPGFTSDLAGNTITVPYDGYYLLSAGVSIAGGTGERAILEIADADTAEVYARGPVSVATSTRRIEATSPAYLAADTEIKVTIYVVGGTLSYEGDADEQWTAFSALFLGTAADDVFVLDGAPTRQGSRALPALDAVKMQGSVPGNDGFVIWTQKVGAAGAGGDSADVNIDGAIIVKHGKEYIGTAGYADTAQIYTAAGSAGTIVGANNFEGLDPAVPYAPGAAEEANGFVRVELGPVWPRSEVARFNNDGAVLFGHTLIGSRTCTQTGNTVTITGGGPGDFDDTIIGMWFVWVGAGMGGQADRITGWVDGANFTVETAREVGTSVAAQLWVPNVAVRGDGTVEAKTGGGFVVQQRREQNTGNLAEWRDSDGETLAAVDLAGVQTAHKTQHGDRAIPTDADPGGNYVKLQSAFPDNGGMVIWTQKVGDPDAGGDSDDINIDGSIIVKHGKDYDDTNGYADTLQVYTLAGSAGTIIGNNNFTELTAPPYAIPGSWNANGYIRFELGPAWPASEVGRFNNDGDFLVGHTYLGARTATQSGTTVTLAGGTVDASIVGNFVVWSGAGSTGVMDRITAFIDSTHVTVETSRTIGVSEGVQLWAPQIVLGADGSIRPQTFTTGARPTAASCGAGAMIYDSTLSKPIWSNGTVWKDAAGTTV